MRMNQRLCSAVMKKPPEAFSPSTATTGRPPASTTSPAGLSTPSRTQGPTAGRPPWRPMAPAGETPLRAVHLYNGIGRPALVEIEPDGGAHRRTVASSSVAPCSRDAMIRVSSRQLSSMIRS